MKFKLKENFKKNRCGLYANVVNTLFFSLKLSFSQQPSKNLIAVGVVSISLCWVLLLIKLKLKEREAGWIDTFRYLAMNGFFISTLFMGSSADAALAIVSSSILESLDRIQPFWRLFAVSTSHLVACLILLSQMILVSSPENDHLNRSMSIVALFFASMFSWEKYGSSSKVAPADTLALEQKAGANALEEIKVQKSKDEMVGESADLSDTPIFGSEPTNMILSKNHDQSKVMGEPVLIVAEAQIMSDSNYDSKGIEMDPAVALKGDLSIVLEEDRSKELQKQQGDELLILQSDNETGAENKSSRDEIVDLKSEAENESSRDDIIDLKSEAENKSSRDDVVDLKVDYAEAENKSSRDDVVDLKVDYNNNDDVGEVSGSNFVEISTDIADDNNEFDSRDKIQSIDPSSLPLHQNSHRVSLGIHPMQNLSSSAPFLGFDEPNGQVMSKNSKKPVVRSNQSIMSRFTNSKTSMNNVKSTPNINGNDNDHDADAVTSTADRKQHYTSIIPLAKSSTQNPLTVLKPIIDDIMRQIEDERVLEVLLQLVKIIENLSVDHDTMMDKQLKEMLDLEGDTELRKYVVSEFTNIRGSEPFSGKGSKESIKTDGTFPDSVDGDANFGQRSRWQTIDQSLPVDLKQKYDDYVQNTSPESWDCCALDIRERPILFSAMYIFEQTGLTRAYKLDPILFTEFFISIEFHYHDENPYHNKYHGADVLQSAYYFSRLLAMSATALQDAELLALFFATAVHDVDHPGLNNNFLLTTEDPLAVLYNGQAVLENHHASLAFRLHDRYPVFSTLSRHSFKRFRELAVSLVLATDFSAHFSLLSEFKTKMAASAGIMDSKFNGICMKMIVKCSDVSNSARTTNIYLRWANLICDEFFEQGDIEKELNLPVSPFMDRRTTQMDKSQIGFIDFIVRPLFQAFHEHFPIPSIMANIDANKTHWTEMANNRRLSLTVTIKAVSTLHRMRRNSLVNLAAGNITAPSAGHVSETIDNSTFVKNLKAAAFGNEEQDIAANNINPEAYESFKTKRRKSIIVQQRRASNAITE